MKKIFVSFMLCIMCFFVTTAHAGNLTLVYDGAEHSYSGSTYKLSVNGKYVQTSVEPLLFNDYALVPIRDVFEAMGATVKYLDLSQQIFIDFNGKYLRLKIGSPTAYVDAYETTIPGGITPMLIAVKGHDAKTMVPARFVSESLGLKVDFDAADGVIKITDPSHSDKINLYSFKSSMFDEETATMEIYSDQEIKAMTDPIFTDSNVLYFDIQNATSTIASSNEINAGPIRYLRVGIHSNMTRLALDLQNCNKYNVTLSKDKKTILISVTQKQQLPNISQGENYDGSKIIVIDAGHGGSDPGTNGTVNGKNYLEKDINLTVAKKVRDILNENGITVLMTREGDSYPSLTDRSDFANAKNAVIFASIHSNSASAASAGGFEIYYSEQNNSISTGISSQQLATSVMRSIAENVNLKNRGVKTANHVVTRTSTMPAVLIEIGFMSNPEELSKMITEDFQNSFAKGVADGILAVIDKANPPKKQ